MFSREFWGQPGGEFCEAFCRESVDGKSLAMSSACEISQCCTGYGSRYERMVSTGRYNRSKSYCLYWVLSLGSR